ncbi:cyclic nucleotide-binding domain-containing protein [Legionella sp. km772]|uniref:cyclic nucleotide-binding domain-containing protein n=1 Tax=Legionella sp. km772 TaxID=2498111 RepID=UPI0013155391|nr:cyclic nucleotide-binding domain-containing protein [Legionella sp. km772]
MSSTFQPLFKSKTFWFAIALAMCDSAAGTVGSIYGYSIILSNYPASALIYYIVLQTIVTSLLRGIGLRLLTKNYKKNALIQYLGFALVFLMGIILMQFKAYAIPFVVAIITSGITSLATIICWSMLSLAFGMREYKSVAKYCNQAAYLSSIIFSFVVPLLVLFYSNTSLLIFVTLMLILCGLAIWKLPVYQEDKKPQGNKKIKPKAIKYALYYYMMLFTVLITTIMGVSQYIMRVESASYFTHEQLSSFFGYFSGITNCIGLLIASTSERVLKRFGLQGLLYSIPLIALVNALAVILYPSFWTIIALGSIRSIFGFSYGAYSAEITLNILPASIRFITKANIKSTASVVSMILLVIFTLGKTSVYYLTCWILPLALIALFFAYKVKQYYKVTLQQESAFKRFNILEEISPATQPILQDIAIKAIQEPDIYTVFYGLDLINKLYADKSLPLAVFNLLEHKDGLVRNELINLIRSRESPHALAFLIKHLPGETELELQRKMIEEIARLNLDAAFSVCKTSSHDLFFPVIKNLSDFLNAVDKQEALNYFARLSQDPNPILRKMLASFIGAFKIKPLSIHLKSLILDKDNSVSDEALRAVALIEDESLIPELINFILSKKNIRSQLALLSFGKKALPHLSSVAFAPRQSKTIIKLISLISAREAEDALISIAQQGTMYHRSIVANYANARACKLVSSYAFKQNAYTLMEEEFSQVLRLEEKIKHTKQAAVQTEIKLRITLAKTMFIQWLAIAVSPKEINQLLTSLIQNQKENEQVFDKAIELLELYVHDKKISAYISFLFEHKEIGLSDKFPLPYKDLWLEQIMKNPDQYSPLLSIVFELRSVRLFHDLPAELLLALAEDAQYLNFNPGELIFAKDDLSDGLYCLTQGQVDIIRDEKTVTTIMPPGFFGELALLDNATRVASAVAQTSCTVLFIEKDVFNRIADDVPDILRTVIKIILEYLRSNLEHRT